MNYILYSICGALGGILGGMGMGGGTVLIPLLSIFFGINQHAVQGINLISFIPMAVVALIMHLKNKLVDFKFVLYIVLPGLVTCVIGFYVAGLLSGDVLRRCFGGFLLLLSVFQFVYQFKNDSK